MNERKLIYDLRTEFQNTPYWEEYEYESIWSDKPEKRYRIHSTGWDFINSKYYHLNTVLGIDIDKDWFVEYLKRKPSRWDLYDHKPGYWSMRWARRREARGQVTHYIRSPHHEKKILSDHEIAKREWRKKKYKRQDQKRNFRASPYFKVLNKKTHRAFERECISNHKTWKLHDRTWKFAEDPWGWD